MVRVRVHLPNSIFCAISSCLWNVCYVLNFMLYLPAMVRISDRSCRYHGYWGVKFQQLFSSRCKSLVGTCSCLHVIDKKFNILFKIRKGSGQVIHVLPVFVFILLDILLIVCN
jgi:hypothetical protein